MIPLDEARVAVMAAVRVLDPRRVRVRDALGLALTDDVTATEPVPPFANTAMDGYAVRAVDSAGAGPASPVRLDVTGELPAGRSPDGMAVSPGQAVRIMTGAPMPAGADAVVMVEVTERVGDSAVLVMHEARPGDHVRVAGGDLAEGQAVFGAGTVLRPAHLGVLTSLGCTEVAVYPRARIGVLSTGDELVESGPLSPGQIRDANRPMLLALLDACGAEPVDLGIVVDDEALITATLEDALARCDAVISSGGVSVGDYDHMKAVLDRLGDLSWWQVAIKPAKPLAFGVVGGIPVFGLPGNPVSSHVSFELFARPAVLRMMGHPSPARPEIVAMAGHDMRRAPDGKLHLDRVRVRYDDGRYVAVRTGAQQSNVLSAMAAANGLALLADGDGVSEGDPLRVMLLEHP